MRAAMTQSVRDRSACPPAGVSPDALASLILVVGAPRSGTTWLAKIIDSHPDVLYRHEPDETLPGSASLTGAALQGLLADWVADRGARSASKRPFFPKSWQPAWALTLRTLFAGAVSAAARLPAPLNRLARVDIPDLMRRPAPRVAIKSVRWAEGAAILARTLPASRTIFILRHPCGQVASVMRGHRQRRFDLKTEGTDMPFDEAATRPFAAAHGISDRSFPALPEAAKYAWSWRAFNEPAYAALAAQPNVHVVLVRGPVRSAANPGAPHPHIRRSGMERADREFRGPEHPPSGKCRLLRHFPRCLRRGGGLAEDDVAGRSGGSPSGRGRLAAGTVLA